MKKFISLFIIAIWVLGLNAQVQNHVTWQFNSKKISEKQYSLIFIAIIDDGWHMYGCQIAEGGPIPTSFKFTYSEGYSIKGKIKEETKPEVKFDSNFGIDIPLHNKKAVFTQLIEVNNAEPQTIKGSLEYMCCNDQTCLPPKRVDFEIALKQTKDKGQKTKDEEKRVKSDSNQTTENRSQIEGKGQKTQDSLIFTSHSSLSTNKKAPLSLVQSPQSTNLLHFLLIALLAGLAGTLTPCVFPMIPMTVSFFLRGSENRRNAIVKGIVFGLSITAIYTLIGLIVALTSLGSGFANVLSTHWIPNLIFFLLFVVFAASFFGLFEIVLPSGIVNKADQQADKGGLAGVFFMALALVLVSFSCTGPIVGALLVEAAGGVAAKPILGMLFFGVAFAIPFTLFAIFPSWLKSLPKSGGWLNAVKVVLGFLIMAFSLKFLSTIDQTYHLGFLSRDIFLAIWMVIAFLLGIYLLGKLRFAHDSAVEHVSFGRLILAGSSFVFAVYLFTGVMGAPLNAVAALIPPQENRQSFFNNNNTLQSSTLCNTPKYSDILHLPLGLQGYFDYNEGYTCARKQNKPVFLDFKGHACSNCKKMENSVWSNPEVLKRLQNNFVIIALYVDDRTELPQSEWRKSTIDGSLLKTIGEVNADLQVRLFNTNTQPFYIITDTTGKALVTPKGLDTNIEGFIQWLDRKSDK